MTQIYNDYMDPESVESYNSNEILCDINTSESLLSQKGDMDVLTFDSNESNNNNIFKGDTLVLIEDSEPWYKNIAPVPMEIKKPQVKRINRKIIYKKKECSDDDDSYTISVLLCILLLLIVWLKMR